MDMYNERVIWTGLNVALNMRCLAMLAESEERLEGMRREWLEMIEIGPVDGR